MKQYFDPMEMNGVQCLEALYQAVGTHSPQALSQALQSPGMIDGLLDQVSDNHNPVSLAAMTGDERLLDMFRSHGITCEGWYGKQQNNILHEMAQQRNDTLDVEYWIEERLGATWLVNCPDIDGQTPLYRLIKHCAAHPYDMDRLSMWIRWSCESVPGQARHMFEKLAKASLGSMRDVQGVISSEEPTSSKVWLAVCMRDTWNEELANILSRTWPITMENLFNWELRPDDSSTFWSKSDQKYPHNKETASWIARQPGLDMTIQGPNGLTLVERALLRAFKPTAGWNKGGQMAWDLVEAHEGSFTIDELAPRLPLLLSLAAIKRSGDGLNREEKAWMIPFWEEAKFMKPHEFNGPQPANMSLGKNTKFPNVSQKEKSSIQQALLLELKTSQASQENRKGLRL